MYLTAFFSALIPLALPIAAFGLILTYYVDKYRLLRVCRKPNSLGEDLGDIMHKFALGYPVFYGLGYLLFQRIINRDNEDSSSYIG